MTQTQDYEQKTRGGKADTLAQFEAQWIHPPLDTPDSSFVATGKYRYEALPLGRSTIRVSAKGFKPKDVPVRIEPGETCETRVVLEKE